MPSQTDLDMGGTTRLWERVYMGPSIGWVNMPSKNFLATANSPNLIIATGIYTLDPSTNFVQVNSFQAGGVTIILPSVVLPSLAVTLPGRHQRTNITIVDVGGFAAANPITIKPASIAETVMNLSQIQITSNYGGFVLEPVPTQLTWVNAQ